MSYCRWSTNNFRCDLYCYENTEEEFIIHVAGRRRVFKDQDLPYPNVDFWDLVNLSEDEAKKEYFKIKENHQWVHSQPLVKIGLPHDGKSFHEPDLESFLCRLLELKEIGYMFPDEVIETVRQEIKDQENREE